MPTERAHPGEPVPPVFGVGAEVVHLAGDDLERFAVEQELVAAHGQPGRLLRMRDDPVGADDHAAAQREPRSAIETRDPRRLTPIATPLFDIARNDLLDSCDFEHPPAGIATGSDRSPGSEAPGVSRRAVPMLLACRRTMSTPSAQPPP
ncbi:hypothetical protein [Saccharopolyspora hattusasensis]|uniref:hypothetical protein n=1 Tax=Saccharopolyspora hattusasensis TaxID=1128679 RepID=UPI003D96E11F